MIPQLFPEKALKPYLLILLLLFSAAFLAGMFAPSSTRQQLTEAFRVVADNYRGLAGGALFFKFLAHNVAASILILISGLLFGIIPTFVIGSNGFILGVVYRQSSEMVSYSKAALEIIPHGVLEIPALIIAASYGLWLGINVLRRICGKESDPVGGQVKHALQRYFVVVFPLLILAAGIETVLILTLQ